MTDEIEIELWRENTQLYWRFCITRCAASNLVTSRFWRIMFDVNNVFARLIWNANGWQHTMSENKVINKKWVPWTFFGEHFLFCSHNKTEEEEKKENCFKESTRHNTSHDQKVDRRDDNAFLFIAYLYTLQGSCRISILKFEVFLDLAKAIFEEMRKFLLLGIVNFQDCLFVHIL